MLSNKWLSSIIVVACTATGGLLFASEASDLRPTLESAFHGYLKACLSGDMGQLQKAYSTSGLATLRARLASAGIPFDSERIKSLADDKATITRQKFERILNKGDTAGLVYSREYHEQGKSRIEFTLIKFVKEGSNWKYAGIGSADTLKIDEQGKTSRFSEADFPPHLQIDGIVKTADAPLAPGKIEVPAVMSVSSNGHVTDISVNGMHVETVEDSSSSGYISSGLKHGENKIEITIRKTSDSPFRPRVEIKIAGKDGKEVQVFNYKSPQTDYVGRHSNTFVVP